MKDLDWRDIPGYEGRYQISRMGEVRSLWNRYGARPKPKMLKPYNHCTKQSGSQTHQYFVNLTDATGKAANKRVAVLMRDTWMGGPRKGMVVYHKNGDVKALGAAMNQTLCGRGGGKPGFFQGSVRATRTEIEAFFGW